MFVNSNFHDWYRDNNRTYNVIFSFAIHHWLDIEPIEYVQRIDSLLMKDGYLCFESHDLCVQDKEFEACLAAWIVKGYNIIRQGEIKDDGCTLRKYVIMRKS